ncbi:MAG: AMP-dependent synthetase and ligase [Rhodospirillales bacterium]|nr:AMP-dependent synthetase and ligase [Rhodospirillales bacterium]
MQWLLDRFATAPERVAFTHEGRAVTYGAVVDRVGHFSDRLARHGIGVGQTVAVLGDYSPEVVCLIFALAQNGNIIIPLTRDSVIEQSAALAISGCDWFARFDEAGDDVTITAEPVPSDNPLLARFRTTGAPGLILFSSGSTGKPKAILHDFDRVAEKFRKQRSSVVAIPFLMLDHFGGINTILAITGSLGTVVTVTDRSVARICQAIAEHRVELLPATPSFLTLLLVSKGHEQYDLSSLRRITYGTEVMPQTTLDRLRALFPQVELQQTYGLSEVGVLRSQSRNDGSLWVRIGGEGFATKVVDDILWIKSDYAMVGYLNAPSEFDAEGWFNTQDRVEVDGEFFRILGRVTDVINVGGQKVYPTEIEDVILALENITDVAVFGEKNPLLGQIVVARVVLTATEPVGEVKKRIRAACQARLAAYKVPAKVVLSETPLHTARHKKTRRAEPVAVAAAPRLVAELIP